MDNVRLNGTALDESHWSSKARPCGRTRWRFINSEDGFNTDSSPHGNTLAPLGKPHTPPAVTQLAEYCRVL